jgi:hypothetical protein
MKPQLDNLVTSSMILFIDHILGQYGEAFINYGSNLFSTSNLYNDYYTYSLPFKQVVADNSISGASIMSGVYINGNFETGNNLYGINPFNGQVYLSQEVAGQISGNFAVKDFNTYLTSKTEQELLFETQTKIRPKTLQDVTGIPPNIETIPAIYIKNEGGKAKPFALGGIKDTKIYIRCVILTDNLYNLDAACSIFKARNNEYFTIIKNEDLKIGPMGTIPMGSYNYTGIIANKTRDDQLYIEDINVSKIASFLSNSPNYSNSIYPAFIDFTLSKIF